MSDLIDTTEMYLRTIFELAEEGVLPMRARIAERLAQSGPTVSQTVGRMQRAQLVELDEGDRHIELTDHGRLLATRVMRKHRIAECLLVEVIGLPLEEVHAEACRWEHVMSESVERRLVELLSHPQVSPFGNPIPGLYELVGSQAGPPPEPEGGPLSALQGLSEAARQVRILRIGETLQSQEDAYAALHRVGVVPGARVPVSRSGLAFRVGQSPATVALNRAQAAAIFVSEDEDASGASGIS